MRDGTFKNGSLDRDADKVLELVERVGAVGHLRPRGGFGIVGIRRNQPLTTARRL